MRNPQQIPATLGKNSNMIIYDSFGILTTKKNLWIPNTQKSICLTAVQVSAPLAVSIILGDENSDFLALMITEFFRTVSRNFYSPYQLRPNNALMVRTADEQIKCDTSGAVTATQVPYNGRDDFENVNNAVGLRNSSVASLFSGLITQTRGNIILDYGLLPAMYDYLNVERVVLKFYCRLSLTVAIGVSSIILSWRPDAQANWIELQQISLSLIGSVNYLINPIEKDITDAVLEASAPWEVISNLQISFVGSHTGVGLGNMIQLDAVEIEICTTGKNQITLSGYEA